MEIKYYLTNKVVFALYNAIGKYILCIILLLMLKIYQSSVFTY